MRRAWRVLRAAVDLDDLVLLLGLSLVAGGCWMTWKPGALLFPGAALVWIALPARKAFIDRPPVPPARRKP